MPLNIKDADAEKVDLELTTITGEALTTEVRSAAEERLQRIQHDKSGNRLAKELLETGARCSALPDFDMRSTEDILGYDKHGLPC